MFDKYICNGYNCSVYVFGASSLGICPECGEKGQKVRSQAVHEFMAWYRTADSRTPSAR